MKRESTFQFQKRDIAVDVIDEAGWCLAALEIACFFFGGGGPWL